MNRRFAFIAAAVAAVALIAGMTTVLGRSGEPSVVIGKARETATPQPAPEPGPPEVPVPPELAPDPLRRPSGGPRAAVGFRGAVNVPGDLLFFLVIGSDARPGQDITRTRADAVRITAVDPVIRKGTTIGIPRDAWVNVPGHGQRKINAALPLGGPDLLVQTVRELTGFPITYYAVTGFEGMVRMTDELGGVDINVPYRMDDHYSGARFEPGWHHMDGNQVLAFTRARHGVPRGDFGRSENHGRVMLHTLEKLRAETSDEGGIRRWLEVLYRHAHVNMSLPDAVRFGMLARQVIPAETRNVVAPGSTATRSGQSVVVLDEAAYALFRDVGANALADGSTQRQGAPPPTPAPTPTPQPTPKPTPSPTPAPTSAPLPTLPFPNR